MHRLRCLNHAGASRSRDLMYLDKSIAFCENAQETGQTQDASFMAVMSSPVIDG
jgi:hypothetical protein